MGLADSQALALLKRMQENDNKAAEQFYTACCSDIYGFLRSRRYDDDLIQDAVQETMTDIWKKPDSFQLGKGASFKTWLLTIADRKMIDLLRKKGTTAEIKEGQISEPLDGASDDGREDEGSTTAEGYEKLLSIQRVDALKHCIGRLKGLHRQLIALAIEHDTPMGDIARQMAMPEGTVKSALFYAKSLMRECLKLKLKEAA